MPPEYVEQPLKENQLYLLFIKMIQSVKETLHHHKDLESNHIMVDIRNTTRLDGKPITKRLFFNKELLPIGNVSVGVGDTIKI